MDEARQLAGQYRLEAEIGQGSMATVYRAFEPAAHRQVAVKVFQERFRADPRFALRFRQHLASVASLEHENLVAVFDYGLADAGYYIVMEWVDGLTLHTAMAEQGNLAPPQAAAIARQVCAALGTVHEHGLVHRDLRPENILLTAGGQVKVTDVGLSSLLSETGLSKTNVMLSGVDYLSPEQARGEPVGPASDIYSIGVLLFEMLTGRLPFAAEDTWAVVGMHAADEPPPVRQVNRRVPVELAWVVDRALDKDRARRFANVQEMETALAAFAPAELPSAPALAASRAPGDGRGLPPWLAQARDSLWHRAKGVLAVTGAFLKDKLPRERLPLSRMLLVQYFVSFLIAFLVFFAISGRALESASRPASGTMEENHAAASGRRIDPEQLQSEARFLLRYQPTPKAPAVAEPTEVPPTATPAVVDQGGAQIQNAGGAGNGGNNGKAEGKGNQGKGKDKGNQGKGKGHGKGGKKK